jgi:DNA processing protein
MAFTPFSLAPPADTMTDQELVWLRLHLTRGLGRIGLLRLMEAFGSPDAIVRAGPESWMSRAGIRPAVASGLPPENDPELLRASERLQQIGARILTLWDENAYPEILRNIHDPPALLYVLGSLPDGDAFAVVGARRASNAGRRLTREICADLAGQGICIVSGLARGIDSAAHEGALEKGATIAVLGCGIDRIYPPENDLLFHRITRQGAILSEYPPGTSPLPGHFPGRNRIISGLSKGVLVVEAAEKSGSLLTADFALEQGREVFAVPGPIYSYGSEGVNQLLKDGAHLVTRAQDILDVLRPGQSARKKPIPLEGAASVGLSGKALTVFLALEPEPLHIDQLARKCSLTPMELSAILLHLEFEGRVEQLPGMRYSVNNNQQ